jgi:hypothetical protein
MSNSRPPTAIDLDKQALMHGSPRPGGAASKTEEVTTRDQVLPILAYCAASIMMTVVNSAYCIRRVDSGVGHIADSVQSSSYREANSP